MDLLNVIKILLLVVGGMVVLLMIPKLWESFQEKRKNAARLKKEMANPPWREPRRVTTSHGDIYGVLQSRLTLVEDRSTEEYDGLCKFFQDTETGQFWRETVTEPHFSQVFVLDPFDEIPPDPENT